MMSLKVVQRHETHKYTHTYTETNANPNPEKWLYKVTGATIMQTHTKSTFADWKNAYIYITVVHKKGSKSSVSNYRPISLTCVIRKMLESMICDMLWNILR